MIINILQLNLCVKKCLTRLHRIPRLFFEEFLIAKEIEEGCAISTIKAYKYDLLKFIDFVGDVQADSPFVRQNTEHNERICFVEQTVRTLFDKTKTCFFLLDKTIFFMVC